MKRCLPALVLCLGVAAVPGQDVFVGGRVDLEFRAGSGSRFVLGRDAGFDLRFQKGGVLDAWLDATAAGGRARVQELYLSFPQTRRVVDVAAGRFLLPFGERRMNVLDRYVAGAPDRFDSFRTWRRGNVFLDTDVTGLHLHARRGPAEVDLVGASPADRGDLCFASRVSLGGGGFNAGGSVYTGRDRAGAALFDAAVHAAWRRRGLYVAGPCHSVVVRDFVAAVSAFARVCCRWRSILGACLRFWTLQRAVGSTRVGVACDFAGHYRAELRYELNDAPGTAGDDLFVARLRAVF
ncbi:MAG: hypothetical protein HYU66_07400 [Armatimonadetes bacterium]|nr:hypothetical protein [Armatimonadota bacterium]